MTEHQSTPIVNSDAALDALLDQEGYPLATSDGVSHLVPFSFYLDRSRRTDYTCGEWGSENNAVADLIRRLDGSRYFTVYEEVRGTHLQPRPGQKPSNVRIDVVLSPTKALVEMGWKLGMIGVEVKRSGVKVGQPLAQMVDYTRSVFEFDGGRLAMLNLVLLYPWNGPGGGPFASMVAQNRLGGITPWDGGDGLTFHSGHTFATINDNGEIELRNNVHRQGLKAGSR